MKKYINDFTTDDICNVIAESDGVRSKLCDITYDFAIDDCMEVVRYFDSRAIDYEIGYSRGHHFTCKDWQKFLPDLLYAYHDGMLTDDIDEHCKAIENLYDELRDICSRPYNPDDDDAVEALENDLRRRCENVANAIGNVFQEIIFDSSDNDALYDAFEANAEFIWPDAYIETLRLDDDDDGNAVEVWDYRLKMDIPAHTVRI